MNGWVKRCWAMLVPIEPDASAAAFAFWIEKSHKDRRTYDDLTRAVVDALDRGKELPPPLARWAAEKAADRRRRPGAGRPRTSRRDAGIAAVVLLMVQGGMTQEAAFVEVGRLLNLNRKTIESAYRRMRTL